MSEEKKPINEGYQPQEFKKGYQPLNPCDLPKPDPTPQDGYQPASSGENPTNQPIPPGDE